MGVRDRDYQLEFFSVGVRYQLNTRGSGVDTGLAGSDISSPEQSQGSPVTYPTLGMRRSSSDYPTFGHLLKTPRSWSTQGSRLPLAKCGTLSHWLLVSQDPA